MSVDILKLKALAAAAKRDQYDCVALNDYGMAMAPAVTLELIAEIERHRQVDAEGCKPDLSLPPLRAPSLAVSSIREAMEHRAAGGNVAELQIGETHLRVTYYGIKWHHDRRLCNRWEPLAIVEFDQILCAMLNHHRAFEVDHG
jgi:hypothetical protein